MTIRTAIVAFLCQGWFALATIGCDKAGNNGQGADAAADVPVGSDLSTGGTGGATGIRSSGVGGEAGAIAAGGIAMGGAGGIAMGGAGGIAMGGAGDIAMGGAGGIAMGGAGGTPSGGRRDAAAGGVAVDGAVSNGGAGGKDGGGTGVSSQGGSGGGSNVCPPAAPSDGSACNYNGVTPCYYEDCAGSGRALATCGAGVWAVTTGPCGFVACEGICTLGQVCLETFSGYSSRFCVNHSCGTGPVTPDCVMGTSGSCWMSASIADGAQITCNTCSGSGGCQ